MHFQLKYIVAAFELGDDQLSIYDPVTQISVLVGKRSDTETYPPFASDDGVAIASCQRQLPLRLHDEAVNSGSLSIKKGAVQSVYNEMSAIVLHALRLVRWRTNSTKSPPNPVRWAGEFSWSADGTRWKDVSDTRHLTMELNLIPELTNEVSDFVQTVVLTDASEPLGHELLREAWVNRHANPRSSLVLAVAAAEVGFKHFAAKTMPDSAWILEKLQTPPLIAMCEVFPWSNLKARINGNVPAIPEPIIEQLQTAVALRNKVVHSGAANLKAKVLNPLLMSVREFLYFLDALSGQTWALKYVQVSTLKQFASTPLEISGIQCSGLANEARRNP